MQVGILASNEFVENLTAEIVVGAVFFGQGKPNEPTDSRTDKVAVFVVCVKRKAVLL